jgi:zinc protease
MLFAMASTIFGGPKETPPQGPPPKPFKLPAPEDFTLPNGMQVTIVPYGIVPKLAVRAFVEAGGIDESADRVADEGGYHHAFRRAGRAGSR